MRDNGASGELGAAYGEHWQQHRNDTGGTITHHHGVGRLKARFLVNELGETGVDVLTRIRAGIDPAGIMNPQGLRPMTKP